MKNVSINSMCMIMFMATTVAIFPSTTHADCSNTTVGCFIDPNGPHQKYIADLFDENHKIGQCFHWFKGCIPCHYTQKALDNLCNSTFSNCMGKCKADF